MGLYICISIAVVILTAVAISILFIKRDLKDLRYFLGILASSIIAVIGSLFFPKLMSLFSVNLALQFVLSIFIVLLFYIIILFLVMVLGMSLIPEHITDKLAEKWKEKKSAWKDAKEKRLKASAPPVQTSMSDTAGEYKESEEAVSGDTSKTVDKEASAPPVQTNISDTAGEYKESEEAVSGDTSKTVDKEASAPPVQTNISDTAGEYKEAEETVSGDISKAVDKEASVPPVQTNMSDTSGEYKETEETDDDISGALTAGYEEFGKHASKAPVLDNKDVFEDKNEDTCSDENIPRQVIKEDDLFDKAVLDLSNSLENEENREKIVDTTYIIDKMGIEKITDKGMSISEPDEPDEFDELAELSLDETIEKAFALKQNGKELEAAALYMNALEKKPDAEITIWLVLYICMIYKNAGQVELAEDILTSYIDEFEDIMSEDVKEQILQTLVS